MEGAQKISSSSANPERKTRAIRPLQVIKYPTARGNKSKKKMGCSTRGSASTECVHAKRTLPEDKTMCGKSILARTALIPNLDAKPQLIRTK